MAPNHCYQRSKEMNPFSPPNTSKRDVLLLPFTDEEMEVCGGEAGQNSLPNCHTDNK